GDASDAFLVRARGAEHVAAHRPVQRGGIGLRGEELRRQVYEPDVVVAGDEPQLDRRHPRDRLLLAQAHVDRIGITLQLRQRDRLTERHTRLPSGRRDGVFWARTIEPRKESTVRYRPAVP